MIDAARLRTMKTTQTSILRFVLLGFIIPTILSVITYVGFSTNYTRDVFTKQRVERQYQTGVYKYRVVGPLALFKTYDLIRLLDLPTVEVPASLNALEPDVDRQFYSAYLYLNTFFLCLTSMTLFVLLNERHLEPDFLMADIPLLFLNLLMTTTQYVVVPYDSLSYFLLSLAMFLILHKNKSTWSLIALCAVVVLAALTRETAIFILIFYIVVHSNAVQRKSTLRGINREQATLLIISGCYFLTYFGLRIMLGYDGSIENSFSNGTRLIENFRSIYPILGMLFILSVAALFFTTRVVTKEMILFLQICSPYILFVLLSANPWEIRLWIPILFVLVVLKVKALRLRSLPA